MSLGLAEKGTGAEDEGWGLGQPGVKVMGREIKIMRRHGYEWKDDEAVTNDEKDDREEVKPEEADSQETLKQEHFESEEEPALWGLDLEALRASNGPLAAGARGANGAGLPIYSPQNARSYLLKSFASPTVGAPQSGSPSKKSTAAAQKSDKEENLGKLLKALDLLHASWAHVLSRDELDRRAWSWYVAVRPDVKDGAAGWGGKGEVSLGKILDLRRKG